MRVIFTDELQALKLPKVEYLKDKAFECAICADDKEEGSPYVLAAGDPVCCDCYIHELVPKFEAAVTNEDNYPVMWADKRLQLPDFPGVEHKSLMIWVIRTRMYDTPLEQRLFCQHLYHIRENGKYGNEAVGQAEYEKSRGEGNETGECLYFLGSAAGGKEMIECDSCRGESCGKCGTPFGFENKAEGHECDPTKRPSVLAAIDETLVRGVDYQKCPSETCGRVYGLWDGCNAMVCDRCHTGFCYICGERATERSRHFSEGSPCPRFGHPGSSRAFWDAPRTPTIEPPQDVPDLGIPLQIDRDIVKRAMRMRRGLSYLKHVPSDDAIASGDLTSDEWESLRRMDLARVVEASAAVEAHMDQAEEVIRRFGDEWLPRLSSLSDGFARHGNYYESVIYPLARILLCIDDLQKKWKPVDPKAVRERFYDNAGREHLDYWIEGQVNEYQHARDEVLERSYTQIMAQDPAVFHFYGIDPRMIRRWTERMSVFAKQWSDIGKLADEWDEEARVKEAAAETLRQLDIAKEEEEIMNTERHYSGRAEEAKK